MIATAVTTLAMFTALSSWSIILFLIAEFLINHSSDPFFKNEKLIGFGFRLPTSLKLRRTSKDSNNSNKKFIKLSSWPLWQDPDRIKSISFSQSIKTIKNYLPIWQITMPWVWYFLYLHQLLTIPYFLFISALMITLYTDLRYMLISRFVSLYLVPIGIIFAYYNLLPISMLESAIAAFAGYAFFWTANYIFYKIKKCDGLGQGDLDLIACIGSFIGFAGLWFTITLSSLLGTLCGISYMLITKKPAPIMAFGAFLAVAAIGFVMIQNWL